MGSRAGSNAQCFCDSTVRLPFISFVYSRQQAAGSRQQAVGSGQQASGSRQQATF